MTCFGFHFVGLVSEITFFHPSYCQQVNESAEGSISKAIFGGAGVAVGMFDWGFVDGVAAHFYERGEKAVCAVEES